jgi:hypothetical protein
MAAYKELGRCSHFHADFKPIKVVIWAELNIRFIAPQLPNSFGEMEPLFSAVICGCNAGPFREALGEVYIPRILRGNARFAAKILGATGQLLSVLVHFFEDGRWGSLVETAVEGLSLTAEDQLLILMQAAAYLAAREQRPNFYERASPCVRIWRSGNVQSHPEDVDTPVVSLCHKALSEWHLGELVSCKAKLDEAISLAKKLTDTNALALALGWAAGLAARERQPAAVDRLASDLIELSTRYNLTYFLSISAIYHLPGLGT